jgi:ABC-type antimicrobial peptide transport system ATPase subunit
VLVRIANTSIAQEIAEALVANGNRTPKMNRWIEKAPKKKRDSIERTLQIWIKECRGVVESTTEDIVEKRVQ